MRKRLVSSFRFLLFLVTVGLLAAPTTPDAKERRGTDHPDWRRYRIAAAPTQRALDDAPERPEKARDVDYCYNPPDDEEEDGEDGDGGGAETFDVGGWVKVDLTEVVFPTIGVSTFGDVDLPTKTNVAAKGGVDRSLCLCELNPGPGYATAPGYGNNWDVRMQWAKPVGNPLVATNVHVTFAYNYDTEPEHDFFRFEVEKSGVWVPLVEVSGSNKAPNGLFPTPAVFDQVFPVLPGEYGGAGLNEVRLRLRVVSDFAGSDEDGRWPSDGAAQVDDLRVEFNDVLQTADNFDLGLGNWQQVPNSFFGDFSNVMAGLQDLDPCRENSTLQINFIDDGTPPRNGGPSTGGAVPANPDYAYAPGGFVVNYDGGVSNDGRGIHNVVYSVPFPCDPDPTKQGLQLEFGVWKHLPLDNGMFYLWEVRGRDAVSGQWSPWRNHSQVYYSPGAPEYDIHAVEVTTLLPADADSFQVCLGVIDMADFLGLPGQDATPSPWFDNVRFGRFALEGPAIYASDAHLFQDSFPVLNANDPAGAPFDYAVRLDMATDIDPSGTIVPGDSIVVQVTPSVPGSQLASVPVLRWYLRGNPLFNSSRVLPPGTTALASSVGNCNSPVGTSVFTNSVVGQPLMNSAGQIVPGWYTFDLADGPNTNAAWQSSEAAFFFAGDELHYYIEANDTLGNTTTLPEDLTGVTDFRDCSPYAPRFRVRGLPSVFSVEPDQPDILVINDTGHGDQEYIHRLAMQQNGLEEHVDYDMYTVKMPHAGLGNGIAGRPGPSLIQLSQYHCLVYLAGEEQTFLMNDGSGDGRNDDGNDVLRMANWHTQPEARSAVYFGDNLVSGLLQQSVLGANYVNAFLSVSLINEDVRPLIGGQVSPTVAPTGSGTSAGVFSTSFVAGQCFTSEQFDHIEPDPPAVRSHEFLKPNGLPGYSAAAGVWHDRIGGPDNSRRLDVVFPFALTSVYDTSLGKAPPGANGWARLLGEVLGGFAHPPNNGAATGNDELPGVLRVQPNVPNPFNPATEIRFSVPRREHVVLRILDVRGQLVSILSDEVREAGSHTVVWNGRDGDGRPVASGVYIYEVQTPESSIAHKMALIR